MERSNIEFIYRQERAIKKREYEKSKQKYEEKKKIKKYIEFAGKPVPLHVLKQIEKNMLHRKFTILYHRASIKEKKNLKAKEGLMPLTYWGAK